MFAAAIAVIFLIPAQAGTKIDDPIAFVKGIYTHWRTNKTPPEDIYTDRLQALRALNEKKAGDSPGRTFDFDLWCDCQDGEISKVKVKGWRVLNAVPDRMVVEAKFLLETNREHLQFYFNKTKAGWKLDDKRSLTLDGWTLSLMLK